MSTLFLAGTVLVILACVVLEGFFSGSETGIYVVNRIRLQVRAENREPAAVRLQRLLRDPRGLITTTLVGTNLAVFGSSALVTRLIAGQEIENPEVVSTLILSPLLFVFAEVVPKNLFRRHADVFSYRFSGLLHLSAVVFKPVVVMLKGVTSVWDLLLGKRQEEGDPLRSRRRLLSLLMTGAEEGVLTQYQHDMAGNVLRAASLPIERAMVPVHEVVAVDDPVRPEQVLHVLSTEGHSRYPVRAADGSMRDVLDATDYLMAYRSGGDAAAGIRPMVRMPVGTPVPIALERLQGERPPVALVVGATDQPLGIITIKDLVEEIVGELGDW